MRQGKKYHRPVTKWCTGREWPVNCMTVISARWRLNLPFQRRRSCIFHWRGRAWLTIWDSGKIPWYSHRLMHQKRVTCELHDSYFRSMTITHAIPKTTKVTHPDGQISEEIAGTWRRVHISAWELGGNIRPTNWTEDSEKFRGSRKRFPTVPRVRCLGHRLLTSKSPSLIDERF